MKRHSTPVVTLGVCCFSLVACGADAGGPAESTAIEETPHELVQVAAIAFDDGKRLEFYEGFEGALVISGAGPVSSSPVSLDRTLNAVQVFQKLAPNLSVPTSLVDAQARADAFAVKYQELKLTRPPRSPKPDLPPTGESDLGTDQSAVWGDDDSACRWSWFSTTQCGPSTQSCLGFVDGAKSIQHDDVNYAAGTTCNYRNGHNHLQQYRPWWSWSSQGTWFVAPGTFRWAEWWNPTIDFDSRVVVQANGANPGSHMALRSNTSGFRTGP